MINRLIFEIHGEVWDSYGDCITVSQCFTVCRKERTVTLRDFETEELEQAVVLDSGQMAKLLKWIVHTLEIFMWPQDYGLRGTGGPVLEMSPDSFHDPDGEGWTDTREDTGQDQDEIWQTRIEYSNGMVQEIYGGDEELPDRAEPRRKACSQKSKAGPCSFAGAWGVPNKQSGRPEGTERWKGISVKDIPFHCLPRLSRIFRKRAYEYADFRNFQFTDLAT